MADKPIRRKGMRLLKLDFSAQPQLAKVEQRIIFSNGSTIEFSGSEDFLSFESPKGELDG